ncbi:MAG: hypothetical protein JWM53_3101 [bacterium]|nr:hypothetical protein [bacterium]
MGPTRRVALAIAGSALAACLLPACSDSSCKRGTLSLRVLLEGTSPLADTIAVADEQSNPPLHLSFAHPPFADGFYDVFYVEVAWPGGYPTNDIAHLDVRALAGDKLLGENEAAIRLDPGCTSGHVYVLGDATPDASTTD